MSGEPPDLRDEPEDWRSDVLNTALRVTAGFYALTSIVSAGLSYSTGDPPSNAVALLITAAAMMWAAFSSRGSVSVRAAVAVGTTLGAGLIFIPFVGINSTVTSMLIGAAMLALLTLGPRAALFVLAMASLGFGAAILASFRFGWAPPPRTTGQWSILVRNWLTYLAFGGGSVAAVYYIVERLERTTRALREKTTALRSDITERQRLEGQLIQAAKMEAVGRLAGGIAHDFNNLMTIILGYAEILHDSTALPPSERRHLDSIRAAASSASSMTRQLLAFGRKQILAPQTVDLNETVNRTLQLLTRLLGEHIAVDMRRDAELYMVLADPGQLEQVILNLCVNARDAMPNGGRLTLSTANVTLTEDEARLIDGAFVGSYATLTVTDTGVGIAASELPRIFEPFYTTKESAKGTGLGLATVYGIVRQSGGAVSVRSEPGAGTSFTILLPRVAAGAAAIPAAPVERRGGNETILLVEDEPDVREIISLFLSDVGYTVLQAENGADALRVCELNPRLDLVVTDIVMPGMGGPELAARLATTLPLVRVLLMSGYTNDPTLATFGLEPNRAILQKPFTRDGLLAAVRQVFDDTPTSR